MLSVCGTAGCRGHSFRLPAARADCEPAGSAARAIRRSKTERRGTRPAPRSDRALSRRVDRTHPSCFHGAGGCRPWRAVSEIRRRPRADGKPAVGRERESALPISRRARMDGRESRLDILGRRGVCRAARRCDERGSGIARTGQGRRQSRGHPAAESGRGGECHPHRACGSRSDLRSAIRSPNRLCEHVGARIRPRIFCRPVAVLRLRLEPPLLLPRQLVRLASREYQEPHSQREPWRSPCREHRHHQRECMATEPERPASNQPAPGQQQRQCPFCICALQRSRHTAAGRPGKRQRPDRPAGNLQPRIEGRCAAAVEPRACPRQ